MKPSLMVADIYVSLGRETCVVFVPVADKYVLIPTQQMAAKIGDPGELGIPIKIEDPDQFIFNATGVFPNRVLFRDYRKREIFGGMPAGLWPERVDSILERNGWTRQSAMRLPLAVRAEVICSLAVLRKHQIRKDIGGMLSYSHVPLKRPRGGDPVDFALSILATGLACAPYFYGRYECLASACLIVRILRKRGHPAVVNIGVRHQPFLAHAWASLDGKIIGEEPNLENYLNVFFSGDVIC